MAVAATELYCIQCKLGYSGLVKESTFTTTV